MKNNEDVQELADAQGWNEHSLLAMAQSFIRDNNLMPAFVRFLENEADCENCEELDV